MGWRWWCGGLFVLCNLGCMGFFPFFALSSLSQDNQDQLNSSSEQPVTYYTRLQPPSFDDDTIPPRKHHHHHHRRLENSGLSSQDIHGTPVANSVEIQRSDLLAEVQDSQKTQAKSPPQTQQSFHTLLNNCAKNDLFNELGAGLTIKPSEQAQCTHMQTKYFNTLKNHYSTLQHDHTTLLQDMVAACHTRTDKQALLRSAFFRRLKPTLKGRKQRFLLQQLMQTKPLSRQKLHALLQEPNLGERFYRCQYFIRMP
ncbi:hypothetical protein ACFOPX_02735 [Helicobacter baculiformis]|uniref:Uncharacterized protein n=1 Tax=Helicobacter baculiformis TaxID=427351 RepID=A0ABV7ZI00_9HELI|nr:hypothetical protein [Helicobacter baculiformis]